MFFVPWKETGMPAEYTPMHRKSLSVTFYCGLLAVTQQLIPLLLSAA